MVKVFRLPKFVGGKEYPLAYEEWVVYANRDSSLIKFIDSSYYKEDMYEDMMGIDPFRQLFWHLPNQEYAALSFLYDEYTSSLQVDLYTHNSETLGKIMQVASALHCRVKYKDRVINQKYMNDVLDQESGPPNEWGDPPFSKNVNDEPEIEKF